MGGAMTSTSTKQWMNQLSGFYPCFNTRYYYTEITLSFHSSGFLAFQLWRLLHFQFSEHFFDHYQKFLAHCQRTFWNFPFVSVRIIYFSVLLLQANNPLSLFSFKMLEGAALAPRVSSYTLKQRPSACVCVDFGIFRGLQAEFGPRFYHGSR